MDKANKNEFEYEILNGDFSELRPYRFLRNSSAVARVSSFPASMKRK